MLTAEDSLSKQQVWPGRVVSALAIAFLVTDSVVKFIKPAPVAQTFGHLGLPLGLAGPLGMLCLICTAVYAIPRTAPLGAVLLMGYLGGAVATHLRLGDPLFSHVLFPTYLGAAMWVGLFLRDVRVRRLMR